MAELTRVVCGVLTVPRRRRQPANLHVAIGTGRADARLRIDRASTDLQGRLSDLTADLLEVATYVYVADQTVTRGGTREFEYGAR